MLFLHFGEERLSHPITILVGFERSDGPVFKEFVLEGVMSACSININNTSLCFSLLSNSFYFESIVGEIRMLCLLLFYLCESGVPMGTTLGGTTLGSQFSPSTVGFQD